MAVISTDLINVMLDEATDATNGIAKIKLSFSDFGFSSVETIAWNAASGGSVAQSSDVVFNITAGKTVQGFILMFTDGTTAAISHTYNTAYTYSEAGTFTVRNTILSISELT